MTRIIEALAEFLDGLLPRPVARPIPVRVKADRPARPPARDPHDW